MILAPFTSVEIYLFRHFACGYNAITTYPVTIHDWVICYRP